MYVCIGVFVYILEGGVVVESRWRVGPESGRRIMEASIQFKRCFDAEKKNNVTRILSLTT